MEQELFNDLIQACEEAIEYEKGNLELKTKIIERPDYNITEKYNLLPEDVKQSINIIIDNAFKITRANIK